MCRELFGLDAGEGAPLFNVLPESASGMLKELWNTALSGADVAGTMDSPCSLSARFVPLPDARGQVSSVMLSLSAGENAPAGTEPQSPDLRAPGDALLQDAAEWAPVMLGTLFVGASLSVAGNSVFRAAFGLEERPPAPMEPARFFPPGTPLRHTERMNPIAASPSSSKSRRPCRLPKRRRPLRANKRRGMESAIP
jgi:hypothetical protein